jgi:medium-chain acyl-[acyl-carrier-protein] hydrolase
MAENTDWRASFPIRRWQIDFNGHVNNLRYLDWMLEPLPDEIYKHHHMRELNLRYEKEAGPEGSITARVAELPSAGDGLRRVAHQILLKDSEESIAVAETAWEPA